MRIYSMTATFGSLENQTLTLEPGLNILEKPNEWGKSTWCAFLMAMFYGLETRERSKKTALAEKKRYQPWSGSPMSGRIDLCWQGRDITIERTSRQRIPLGQFRAYETASGLPVPELTGENCGELLLGAERSVYRRTGFLRLQDLPVTQDEALLRRLQALVTTGDDSGSADRLAQTLRDLKNRCRYNRSGLLPQAEAELERLEGELDSRRELDRQTRELEQRLEDLGREETALRGQLTWLQYRHAQTQVEEARQRLEATRQKLTRVEQRTEHLPEPAEIRDKLDRLRELQAQRLRLEGRRTAMPQAGEEAPLPAPYGVPDPGAMVRQDQALARVLDRQKGLGLILPAVLCLGLGVLLAWFGWPLFGLGAGVLALALGLGALAAGRRRTRQRRELTEKYGSADPESWSRTLENLQWVRQQHRQARQEEQARWRQQELQWETLERSRESLCGSQEPQAVLELWTQALDAWQQRERLNQELSWRQEDLAALERAIPELPQVGEIPPTCSREAAGARLAACRGERQRLSLRLGQLQGRAQLLPIQERCLDKIAAAKARLTHLEDTNAALELAMEALEQTRQELQRRFAPRIVSTARELMARLTGGRYDRLTLDRELSLQAGTREEPGLTDLKWRSDGTVDQLYLALRLAVARELIPQAPLVLDDALARFDDARLKAALELLKDESSRKQVILFTCQDRERRALGK